ncbi:hypothetical protein ACOMHN_006105 [Nucella lapillus]
MCPAKDRDVMVLTPVTRASYLTVASLSDVSRQEESEHCSL